MTAEAIAKHHLEPCESLRQTRETMAAHGQALANAKDWQERLESRVNQIYVLAVGAMLSALGSLVVGLLMLAISRGLKP